MKKFYIIKNSNNDFFTGEKNKTHPWTEIKRNAYKFSNEHELDSALQEIELRIKNNNIRIPGQGILEICTCYISELN